eukprot:10546231-Alexandrium_andersonii.AAC.1
MASTSWRCSSPPTARGRGGQCVRPTFRAVWGPGGPGGVQSEGEWRTVMRKGATMQGFTRQGAH